MSARDYQRAAIDALFAYWGDGGGNPLIDMATGTGKSVVISTMIRETLEQFPGLRILALVHSRELVEQNAKALLRAWPQAPIGINSAGLGRRDRHSQVLFASIQSVHRDDAHSLGKRDLVIIDECHMTPRTGDGMYLKLLGRMREAVPDMRVVGLSATIYRLDSGRLDQGEPRIFDEVVYSYGIGDGVRDGWLAPLISKVMSSEIDVSGVAKRGGEFIAGDLERAADKSDLVEAAVTEIIERGADRKSWIVFCSGVNHASRVRDAIRRHGITCEVVTGETPTSERDRILRDFKAGRIRCLTNMGVLTTGFDAPGIDLIAMLRPTLSTGLYCQKLGRGTRPVYPQGFDPNTATADERVAAIVSSLKPNCLVLDFSGNVRRHGPVDQIVVRGRVKKQDQPGEEEATGRAKVDDVKAKPCPECESLVSVAASSCPDCGYSFPVQPEPPKHAAQADDIPVMAGTAPKQDWSDVTEISFHLHRKKNDPAAAPTMRVEYTCGLIVHQEWVCFQHEGFARQKAVNWWRRAAKSDAPPPSTIEEAISRAEDGAIAYPSSILTRPKGSFVEILSYRFDPDQSPRLRTTYHSKAEHIVRSMRPEAGWWTTLGVSRLATEGEIKAAFRRLAMQQHPDQGGSNAAMAALNAAYQEGLDELVPF